MSISVTLVSLISKLVNLASRLLASRPPADKNSGKTTFDKNVEEMDQLFI